MQLEKIRESFQKNGFSCTYFETKEEAVRYLAKETAGKSLSLGGSMTLLEMGAYEALAEHSEVSWHWKTEGVYKQDAEVYITSANALSETGEIINIDGACNRVAGSLYGAKECFVVCGVNKLAPDLTAAVSRARNVAAPKNAQRLGRKTPCADRGDRCYNCKSPERICRALVVLYGPPMRMERYEVILVGENLGY